MKKVILLSLLFLIPLLGIAPVANAELDTYDYDPVYWEDYSEEGTGSYTWQEENATMLLQAAQNTYTINRDFNVPEDEEDLEFSYWARYQHSNNSVTGASWWDTDWNYRKKHTLTGGGSVGTNYQIRLIFYYGSGSDSGNTIYLNSHSQTDFDDIRFLKDDQATEFDYWLENSTASDFAYFWVEVDSIAASPSTTDIYIYYGNDAVGSNSNGDDTFLLFDDFNDGSIDWSKWIWQNDTWLGEPVENAGLLMLNDTSDRIWMSSNVNYTHGVAITGYIYFDDMRYFGFCEYEPDIGDDAAAFMCYPSNEWVRVWDEGSSTQVAEAQIENVWQFYSLRWYSAAKAGFYIDFSNVENITTANVPDGTPNIPTVFYTYHGDPAEKLHLDWVFVHTIVDDEPKSASTGSEDLGIHINEFRAVLLYQQTVSVGRSIELRINQTYFIIDSYSGSGSAQSSSYSWASLSTNYYQYFLVEFNLDALDREFHVEVSAENGTEVIDYRAQTEATPTKFTGCNFTVEANSYLHTQYNATSELVWVDAPFDAIDSLRAWTGTDTGDEDEENPYTLYQTDSDDENYQVKVMPFQGFKALWNWTMGTDNGNYAIITFDWRKRDGTSYGLDCEFWISKSPSLGYIFGLDIGPTNVLNLPVSQSDEMAIALWVDASGEVFMYTQTDPASHTFSDFWVYTITDYADFDSWGCVIEHEIVYTGNTDTISSLREVEIYHGVKEGISQPLFGGMWWQYNILIIAWMAIVNFLQLAFTVTLLPVIAIINSVWASVITLITWASDIFNIVNALIAAFFAYIVPNAILGIWLATMNIINGVLEALGILLFGDANLIKNAVLGFMVAVQAFFGVIVTAIIVLTNTFFLLANLALGVPVVGVDLTGAISWINAIIYYVVTFAPIAVFLHLLTAIFRTVRAMDIMILVDASMFYLKIAEFLFNIVREVVSMVIQGIQVIMDIIPF